MDIHRFAKRIKKERRVLGLSQEQLAKKARLCRASVIAIEQGRILPRVDAAFRIGESLGIELWLMAEDVLGKK